MARTSAAPHGNPRREWLPESGGKEPAMSTPHRALPPPPASYALARDAFGREIVDPNATASARADGALPSDANKPKKEMATDALGRRAGALSDEIDFPAFVTSLVHGTFDAMVSSSIRQMQSFADLVAAVSKPL